VCPYCPPRDLLSDGRKDRVAPGDDESKEILV